MPSEARQHLRQFLLVENVVAVAVELPERFLDLSYLLGGQPARREGAEPVGPVLFRERLQAVDRIEGVFGRGPEFHRIVAEMNRSAVDNQRQVKTQLGII